MRVNNNWREPQLAVAQLRSSEASNRRFEPILTNAAIRTNGSFDRLYSTIQFKSTLNTYTIQKGFVVADDEDRAVVCDER